MKCPICRRNTVRDYRPFCSKRCADVDLGRWFNESYSVPSDDETDEADAPPTPGNGISDEG